MTTTRETLLRVAASLPQPFTTEELAVAAWKENPKAFGLPGFEGLYPDKARLRNCLYGVRGAVTRREIVRDGERFRVRMMPRSDATPVQTARVPTTEPALPMRACLIRAADTAVYLAYKAGNKRAILFSDALHFWGVSPAAQPDAIRAAVAEFDRLLLDRDGPDEIRALGACHDFLTGAFQKQLKRAS